MIEAQEELCPSKSWIWSRWRMKKAREKSSSTLKNCTPGSTTIVDPEIKTTCIATTWTRLVMSSRANALCTFPMAAKPSTTRDGRDHHRRLLLPAREYRHRRDGVDGQSFGPV